MIYDAEKYVYVALKEVDFIWRGIQYTTLSLHITQKIYKCVLKYNLMLDTKSLYFLLSSHFYLHLIFNCIKDTFKMTDI